MNRSLPRPPAIPSCGGVAPSGRLLGDGEGWSPRSGRGTNVLPSPPRANDGAGHPSGGGEVGTREPARTVSPVLAALGAATNSLPDIRDIKGEVPVPVDWRWLWLALVLAGLAGLAWWWWRRRQPKPAAAAAPVPGPTPDETATAALRRLRADDPPVEPFYTRLSDIVRHYLEDRFHLRAPERTTEEFLVEVAQSGVLSAAHRDLLAAFLVESDLVKFARHQPSTADRDRAFAAAERFVEETRAP